MDQKQRTKQLDKLEREGVTLVSRDGVVISEEAILSPGVVIYPGTVVEGASVIGGGCILGPNTMLVACRIGVGVRINSSQCYHSEIDDGSHIGPYAHVRPDCKIGKNVKIGAYVEIKNSAIGDGTSLAHLCYVGDCDVGEDVNFGCGVVTANYDGKQKYRSTIGDNAFIGCNTNIISPVKIGNNAYIAAGSNIDRDVPEGSLAIGRERPNIKEGWSDRFFNRK